MGESSFLENLLKEVQLIKAIKEPTGEVAEGEEVIGEASEIVQKLYTLSNNCRNDCLYLDANAAKSLDFDLKEFIAERVILKTKVEMASQIMWAEIRSSLGCWTLPAIGIREGFQIVKIPENSDSSAELLEVLAKILVQGVS